MDRARIHEGIRRMRFTDVLSRSERSELSQIEAAELLGISERTFRRWRDRHRDAGLPGLDDRRLAPSLRRAPGAGGRYRADAGPVSRSLSRLHDQALPRAAGQTTQLHLGLHGDEAASTSCRSGASGDEAFGASQEAAPAPD